MPTCRPTRSASAPSAAATPAGRTSRWPTARFGSCRTRPRKRRCAGYASATTAWWSATTERNEWRDTMLRMTLLFALIAAATVEDKPLTPVEARKKVGESVTVEMTVHAAKDRLEKRGE